METDWKKTDLKEGFFLPFRRKNGNCAISE